MAIRKKYSSQYKQEAVELARSSGVSIRQVASELGLNANMLSRWIRESETGKGRAFRGTGTPRDEELTSLKRELARVRKERDFLKAAAAFFASESK